MYNNTGAELFENRSFKMFFQRKAYLVTVRTRGKIDEV